MPRLKDEFRTFQTAFSALYNVFLKKRIINEDPYKQETKIGEIEVPETGSFPESERQDQLSLRLSNFDNQLDFLVNFYQFSVDLFSLDQIKRILGLVKFIDWTHLVQDSQSANTKAMVDMINQAKMAADQLSISIISESISNLQKTTATILALLKEVSDFNRESYKLEIRTRITRNLSPGEATPPQIKKKFSAAMPGKPFYPDLVEEVIKEDFSKEGPALREKVLKHLEVPDNKPKIVKAPVSFKTVLIEGLQVIGSVGATLNEIAVKIDENEILLESRANGFWDKVKRVLRQMMNKEPEPTIYEIEYMDPARGVSVREKVNFQNFRTDMDRKTRTLMSIGSRAAVVKLNSMDESQLIGQLERCIREVQSVHKTLSALDDFFKAEAGKEDREKVKGIKPELATMKNAIIRANQKRHEYSAQKEEAEQLKRLGINS
ncbi:MAG: hypothetical protein LBP32_05395 [Spirochaetaceae bacterium]|nr:hypothetical protein [Spirochaetaceae bacterium]